MIKPLQTVNYVNEHDKTTSNRIITLMNHDKTKNRLITLMNHEKSV